MWCGDEEEEEEEEEEKVEGVLGIQGMSVEGKKWGGRLRQDINYVSPLAMF